jgi:1-deoxy-D-xylulose-5-phosphate synthase
LKPFVAIYSTFLQRAYDQVVHDVAHPETAGALRHRPRGPGRRRRRRPMPARSTSPISARCRSFVVMAAADEPELVHMVATSLALDDRPSAFRYPRGDGVGRRTAGSGACRWRSARAACARRHHDCAAVASARASQECLSWRPRIWPRYGLSSTTVADARFAKPLDADLDAAASPASTRVLIVVEEGAIGGFGSHVLQLLSQHDALSRGLKVRSLVLPDVFLDHDAPAAMYARAGLDADGIVQAAFDCLGRRAGLRSAELV